MLFRNRRLAARGSPLVVLASFGFVGFSLLRLGGSLALPLPQLTLRTSRNDAFSCLGAEAPRGCGVCRLREPTLSARRLRGLALVFALVRKHPVADGRAVPRRLKPAARQNMCTCDCSCTGAEAPAQQRRTRAASQQRAFYSRSRFFHSFFLASSSRCVCSWLSSSWAGGGCSFSRGGVSAVVSGGGWAASSGGSSCTS